MVERLACRMPADWINDPSLCWFEWQTLVSGLLALLAAILAGSLLWKQIGQTEALHEKGIRQRHNAARSMLPLALASVSRICQKIADNVASEIEAHTTFEGAFDEAEPRLNGQKKLEEITLPDSIIPSLKSFVETLSDSDGIRHMAELVSSFQILLSRYQSFNFNRADFSDGLYGILLDCAKVKLLTDSIYNYSRFVDEGSFGIVGTTKNEIAWQLIHEKAEGLIFSREIPDKFFKEIEVKINRSKGNNSSPWLEKFGK